MQERQRYEQDLLEAYRLERKRIADRMGKEKQRKQDELELAKRHQHQQQQVAKSIDDGEVVKNARLLEEEQKRVQEQDRQRRLRLIDLNLHNIHEQQRLNQQNKQLASEIEGNIVRQANIIME